MGYVAISVTEVEIDGDYDNSAAGVEITCSKCGHTEDSFGTDEPSINRCAVLLRENCPLGESNFYKAD